MTATLRDIVAQSICDQRWGIDGKDHRPGEWDVAAADALLTVLQTGWLFTAEDARMFRLAIDWIASELRDQQIPPGEYVGTRTFLNGLITRFDQYAALVGTEAPWARTS